MGRGALPQSLIFAGPDGVGKRLVALAVAQRLNCLTAAPDEGDACGTCSACRRIASGTHPDVVTIPGTSIPGEKKVDAVREKIADAAYRPFEGRRRVFILDEADELQPVVQNALLKTLEEPTPSSQFILITARPDGLLPTVRSRCPQLRFGRLDVDDVAALLIARQDMTAIAAREIAFAADGSPGRAFADASAAGRVGAGAGRARHRRRRGVAGRAPSRSAPRWPKPTRSSSARRGRRPPGSATCCASGWMRSASSSATWGSRPPAAIGAGSRGRRIRASPTWRGGSVRRAWPRPTPRSKRRARRSIGNVSFKAVADWVALEL